jgi:hypothetical protein
MPLTSGVECQEGALICSIVSSEDCQCLSPKFTYLKANIARRGSTKCRTRSKRRSLANDMADAIFTHPLLAEGLNILLAMFHG